MPLQSLFCVGMNLSHNEPYNTAKIPQNIPMVSADDIVNLPKPICNASGHRRRDAKRPMDANEIIIGVAGHSSEPLLITAERATGGASRPGDPCRLIDSSHLQARKYSVRCFPRTSAAMGGCDERHESKISTHPWCPSGRGATGQMGNSRGGPELQSDRWQRAFSRSSGRVSRYARLHDQGV